MVKIIDNISSNYNLQMQQAMQPIVLHIFDAQLAHIGILQHYTSLSWQEDYANKGAFSLVCTSSKENIALLKVGHFIYRKEKDTAMMIEYVKLSSESQQIQLRGYTTSAFFAWRVLYPAQSVTNIEEGMYNLVKKNLRGLPNMALATAQGYTMETQLSFEGEDVLSALVTLCGLSGLGFKTQFLPGEKKHVFCVYQGANKRYGQNQNAAVLFADNIGNLKNLCITDDASNYKNIAYTASKPGDDRVVVQAREDAGKIRREVFINAGDIYLAKNQSEESFRTQLMQRGFQKLKEYSRSTAFQAQVSAQNYGSHYMLGDLVTCKSAAYNMQMDARITRCTEIRENNITTVQLSLGSPGLSLKQEVKLWQN